MHGALFMRFCLREDYLKGLVVPADQLPHFQALLLEVFTEGLLCSTHTPRQPARTNTKVSCGAHLQSKGKTEVQG